MQSYCASYGMKSHHLFSEWFFQANYRQVCFEADYRLFCFEANYRQFGFEANYRWFCFVVSIELQDGDTER